jgi:predicted DNA-binding transcriptional regulator AlpA
MYGQTTDEKRQYMTTDSTDSITVRKLLDRAATARHFGVSPVTLAKWVRRGQFPKPKRFGHRTVRWDAQTLDEFIARTGRSTADDSRENTDK